MTENNTTKECNRVDGSILDNSLYGVIKSKDSYYYVDDIICFPTKDTAVNYAKKKNEECKADWRLWDFHYKCIKMTKSCD